MSCPNRFCIKFSISIKMLKALIRWIVHVAYICQCWTSLNLEVLEHNIGAHLHVHWTSLCCQYIQTWIMPPSKGDACSMSSVHDDWCWLTLNELYLFNFIIFHVNCRQYAQRSRVRKLQYIAELERRVQSLQVTVFEAKHIHYFLYNLGNIT